MGYFLLYSPQLGMDEKSFSCTAQVFRIDRGCVGIFPSLLYTELIDPSLGYCFIWSLIPSCVRVIIIKF